MKKGKLFGKIHLLDLIILLALIGVVMTGIGRFSGGEIIDFGSGTRSRVRIEVITALYDEAYFYNLEKGMALADNKKYLTNSEITHVEIIDAEVTKVDNNGQVVTGVHPSKKRALVTIEADAEYKSPIYTIGQQEIREGYSHFILTEKTNLSGTISKMEVIDDQE